MDRAKAPGFNDRKRVHISNIDPFTIVESWELSRGSKSNFLTECGIVITCLILMLALSLGWGRLDATECHGDLLRDLTIVDYWNRRINDRLPVMYNHYLTGGYLVMPSARMGKEGTMGVGYSSVPPYSNTNMSVQILENLELSGNYRVYCGVPDSILGAYGFGDLSDKGVNFKFAFVHPEDSDYLLPGVAVGSDDIHGTRAFKSTYIVFTQVFLKANLEMSLGLGKGRIRGFFGGMQWLPLRESDCSLLKGLALVIEYDAIAYQNPHKERHPNGRAQKTPINGGIKYRLWDNFDLAVSSVRGKAIAWSAAATYNFGETEGFIPKIQDPLPYRFPVNTQPLGLIRPYDAMIQDYLYAMKEQGFTLTEARLCCEDDNSKVLRLKVINTKYREELEVRHRLEQLMAFLTPSDIDAVVIAMESDGFLSHEYWFDADALCRVREREIGCYELDVLIPMREATCPPQYESTLLFKQHRPSVSASVAPKFRTLFGSSRGKIKYVAGINLGLDGMIFDEWRYSVHVGCTPFMTIGNSGSVDMLNPSQIINVRSDSLRYLKNKDLTVDQAYLQKNWNMGCGWFSRVAGGYFETAYGGIATEFLYFPPDSQWAIGFEGAILRKRNYRGIGFTKQIRQLQNFTPTYREFKPWQAFVEVYYDWKDMQFDFQTSIGQFLAKDRGARFEVCRYFDSGLRLFCWYTLTNLEDNINGSRYFDKGVGFSLPLDIFLPSSSRERWGYSMSAWSRDVGARSASGQQLYYLIKDQRR